MTVAFHPFLGNIARARLSHIVNRHPLWASRLSIRNGALGVGWLGIVGFHGWTLSTQTPRSQLSPMFALSGQGVWWGSFVVYLLALVITAIFSLWIIIQTVIDAKRWQNARFAVAHGGQPFANILRRDDFRRWLYYQIPAGLHAPTAMPVDKMALIAALMVQYRRRTALPEWLRLKVSQIAPNLDRVADAIDPPPE
ncbi:MAG TPA: hypothetical protein VM581_04160 [Magnetospirillaceae bacterium]|nr:hypothetical protein [Magnetospirillaceae bacterium]